MGNLRFPRPRLGDRSSAVGGSSTGPRESQVIGGIRLGRIFGIEISIHWSWVFLIVLLTITYGTLLNEYISGWTNLQLGAVGFAVALIFFTSVLLHELSHSLVARRYGIPVSTITLFIFGGVSNLTKEPESAKQEFWIAIVGPLTSLLLAALFGIGFVVFHPLVYEVGVVFAILGVNSALIGFFNLVPGFPLDGGRVLRSFFWSRNRSILEATRLASRIGELVAYLIMGLGIVAFLAFGDWISLIWFFLIGNFLRGASAASYEQLFVEKVLKGIPASTVARQDYIAVRPDETVQQVLDEHVLTGHGRCFPIMAGEELLGLVTLTDIRKVPRDDWATTTVYRVMTPIDKLKTVGLRDDLAGVLLIMATNDVNQVPMMDGRWLRGLIHRSDVIRYIQVRQALGAGATTH